MRHRGDRQFGRAVFQHSAAERIVSKFGIDVITAHGGETVEMIPLKTLRATVVNPRPQITALVVLKMLTDVIA